MAFFLKGIGDATNRINEITPRFDAQILNFLAQNTPGVCWFQTTRFNLTRIDRGVIIGPGMVQAHGYFGMSDANHTINLVLPASGNHFVRVFAEINLSTSPHRFQVRASNPSSVSNIGLVQNNLVTSPSGIHQIPLYLLTISSNGNITSTDQRVQMTRPQNARHADSATHATSATNLTGSGSIATTTTTTTAARTTNSTRIANTAFVHTVVDWAIRFNPTGNAMNITAGRIQLPGGLILLWRSNTSTQSQTFPWAFPNACIWVGFMGNWGTGLTSDNHTARTTGIDNATVSRTGFTWAHQSSATRINQRRYFALGH